MECAGYRLQVAGQNLKYARTVNAKLILSVNQSLISSARRLSGRLQQSFPEGIITLMKEQVPRLAKSAVVQYGTVFRLILAKRVKH